MSFFKIKSIPGAAWPALPDPIFGLLWSAYHELERTQWLKPEEINVAQLKQFSILLAHCQEHVPFYQKTLKDFSAFDLKNIPLLTRQTYQSNFDDIKTKFLPPEMILGENSTFTSGTNGVPIEVRKTSRDELWWLALTMRDFEWNQMDPRKSIAAIRLIAMTSKDLPIAMKGISSPSWFPSANGKTPFESGPAFGLDIRQDPNLQLQWLQLTNPSYLISLPSNLDVLASILKERNLKFKNLEMIQVIGETLDPNVKRRIEESFGVPVTNLYSANECGYIASQCPSGNGMHVHSEHVLTEVLNDKNQDCGPGETGRLVLTNLSNFATPFIRYEILDDVTLADKPCSCGRGLPLWTQINGRRHPMLFLANNRRKVSTGVMLGIRQIGGVHQFQVIQHNVNNFTLKVVPNHEWTDKHSQKMIQCIQNEVEALVHVDVKKYASLERPNGKLKIIVVEPENNK